MEALIAGWMETLAGLKRLWEVEDVTRVLVQEAVELEPPTPLADLIDGDDYRTQVQALLDSVAAAFSRADDFKEVSFIVVCGFYGVIIVLLANLVSKPDFIELLRCVSVVPRHIEPKKHHCFHLV